MKKVISFLILSLLILSGCTSKTPDDGKKIPNVTEYEYKTEKVALSHGQLTLDAEIIIPVSESKVPGVVIVPGSGLVDMDGTVGKLVPYKELAIGLAKHGIASIRFNKVSFQHTASLKSYFDATIEDEFINDSVEAISKLRERAEVDENKIYLIGHSMGAQIVPTVALQDENIQGLILMAGTQMHILDLLLDQVRNQNEATYNEYLPYAEYAKSLTFVPAGEEKYFYFGAYSAYWVSYNALHKKEDLLKVNVPILILQGGLDLQVSVDHFNQYKETLKEKGHITYQLYEKLNHCFTNGENETLLNAYQVYNEVSSDVIDDVASFVLGK